jgi:hypothetical protein
VEDLGREVTTERTPVRAVVHRGYVLVPFAAETGGQHHREDRGGTVREGIGFLIERAVGGSSVDNLVEGSLSTVPPSASPEKNYG